MADGMRCEVEETSGVTVVNLRGSLDMTTARPVHVTLQQCLSAAPVALVVDMSTTQVREQLALSVFAAVTHQAALWPDVPVLLCGPPPESVDWLARTRPGRRVRIRPNRAAALREAHGGVPGPRLRARLQPVTQACRRARELAGEACQRWNLPELAGPARLVLSELVTNVVRHAGTPMEVALGLHRSFLHLAVADRGRGDVQPGRPSTSDEGGRGLLLVREVAQHWGCLPVPDGKVVWARLPLRYAQPA